MIKKLIKKFQISSDEYVEKVDKMEIIITGHSHCFCMGVTPTGELRFERIENDVPGVFGVMGGWDGSRNDAYWEFVAKHAQNKRIVILWAGNQHNSGFIFANEETFDFVSNPKDSKSLSNDKTIVPKSVLEQLFKSSLGGLPRVLEILKKGKPHDIILLETPRPKGDGDFILPFIKSSAHFVELATKSGIDIENLSISSLGFRLKLWRVIQSQLADVAMSQDVTYMRIPEQFHTEEGGLKREFWANDVTHANSNYGKAMLKCIADEVLINSGSC
jgi:hypothetical protein